MTDWLELDRRYLMPTYHRLPIAIARGKGNYLYDTEGKSYLDLFTGLAVNILGHSHPALLKALHEQGDRFLHISNKFLNPPAIRLAERLTTHSIEGKVFFVNSGAEATEAAVKLVHKWAGKHGDGKNGFVVMKKSFHGRTLGAVRLTRQPGVYQDFPQPDFPVYEVEPNRIEELHQICAEEKPAALLAEPILGSGGVQPLDLSYLQEMARLCREQGMLLIMDEIQTGVGRTGTLFAYQQAGLKPDLILFAKGVGGGLPLGGIIAGDRLKDLFQPGDHGTTFAPSPLSAALGNAVLDVLLDQGQLEQGRKNAQTLWQQLKELRNRFPAVIGDIRGRGMMIGVDTTLTPEQAAKLQLDLTTDGVLVDITQQTVIRLLPPLTLTPEEIEGFMQKLQSRLQQILS
ncbi:aspartate aminotransferase family protein [Kroppenstedtia eburnea]|uniref:Acetylornithine aminotransferase n=1 Tax=Kroppenstedtia eburnea TaxID=714067 RepID=A0A1N7NUQ8_9BACL|nr:acetylornithine transaminase [Kroppenstedtia eburnea]QKI81170.1 aminotransferase class III-fold pyridoxal phosphate-dependent enzyme [Kroppenstedtia eburnea]SIT02074.1 acetylornithine aminotransferase [Kroppenstedtia eburnea]